MTEDEFFYKLCHEGMEVMFTDERGVDRVGKISPLSERYPDKIPLAASIAISSGTLQDGDIGIFWTKLHELSAAFGFPPKNQLNIRPIA